MYSQVVRDLVHEGKIEDAFDFLKTNYPKIIDEKLLILAINGQLFLEFIRKGDINKAIEIAQKAFPNYEEEVLDFIDQNGKLVELKVEVNIKIFIIFLFFNWFELK